MHVPLPFSHLRAEARAADVREPLMWSETWKEKAGGCVEEAFEGFWGGTQTRLFMHLGNSADTGKGLKNSIWRVWKGRKFNVAYGWCFGGVLFFFFEGRDIPFCPFSKRCLSQTSWLRFCLFLIHWTVSKHTPNPCLDRLNGCRNTETHYFGTERLFWKNSMANCRAASLSSCFKETTHNWSRHL